MAHHLKWLEFIDKGTGANCSDRPSQKLPIMSQQTCCLMKMTRPPSNTSTDNGTFGMLTMLAFHWTGMAALNVYSTYSPTGVGAPTCCHDTKNTNPAMYKKRSIIRLLSRVQKFDENVLDQLWLNTNVMKIVMEEKWSAGGSEEMLYDTGKVMKRGNSRRDKDLETSKLCTSSFAI